MTNPASTPHATDTVGAAAIAQARLILPGATTEVLALAALLIEEGRGKRLEMLVEMARAGRG